MTLRGDARVLRGFFDAETVARLAALADAPGAPWERGRQETGYEKLALREDALAPALAPWLAAATARTLAAMDVPMLGWDRYLLRYAPGAWVPPHTDPPLARGLRHLRFNALVRAADAGGVLAFEGRAVPLAPGDAVLFRPDVVAHEVSRVDAGTRLVWSMGCNY